MIPRKPDFSTKPEPVQGGSHHEVEGERTEEGNVEEGRAQAYTGEHGTLGDLASEIPKEVSQETFTSTGDSTVIDLDKYEPKKEDRIFVEGTSDNLVWSNIARLIRQAQSAEANPTWANFYQNSALCFKAVRQQRLAAEQAIKQTSDNLKNFAFFKRVFYVPKGISKVADVHDTPENVGDTLAKSLTKAIEQKDLNAFRDFYSNVDRCRFESELKGEGSNLILKSDQELQDIEMEIKRLNNSKRLHVATMVLRKVEANLAPPDHFVKQAQGGEIVQYNYTG